MRHITCPHCGDTYPDFDVAHMCSRGPYAPQLKPRMNERIKELAQQAVYYDKDEESWEFDREKFAEWIVKECVDRIKNADMRDCEGSDSDEVLWLVERQIVKHFGVEE